jgi:hypothetical protein
MNATQIILSVAAECLLLAHGGTQLMGRFVRSWRKLTFSLAQRQGGEPRRIHDIFGIAASLSSRRVVASPGPSFSTRRGSGALGRMRPRASPVKGQFGLDAAVSREVGQQPREHFLGSR